MLQRDAPRRLLDSLLHPARDMLEAKIEQAVVVCALFGRRITHAIIAEESPRWYVHVDHGSRLTRGSYQGSC